MSAIANSAMPRSATLSAFLHLLALSGLLFLAWWSQRIDQEPPAIFELVAGPGDNYMAERAPSAGAEDTPNVNVTLPSPLPEYDPPKPPPPRPEPLQQTRPEPQRPPIERVPEPTPTTIIEPAPEQVSFDDFAKQHGDPTPRAAPKQRPVVQHQQIDVGEVIKSTTVVTPGAGGTAMSVHELSLSQRYVAQIIQRIRIALEKAGINDIREAGVRFNVSATGAISNVSITQSSGSRQFDQAVLSAFRTIKPLGSPPTKRAESFRTVIRLE